MDPTIEEQVGSWESRPVTGGITGLRELSSSEFSGVVRARGTWLFMLNGKVVGIFEGSIEDFRDASATAFEAPHPSLPLLFAMQQTGGEQRARYYTNNTPISEVDETLSSGGFTGYVELTENVLSGDYYLIYYGGQAMSAAFVGNSEQLLTGQEAFERADGEVGIYEVVEVDVDVQTLPEPDDDQESDDDSVAAATPDSDPDERSPQNDHVPPDGDTPDESNEDVTPVTVDADAGDDEVDDVVERAETDDSLAATHSTPESSEAVDVTAADERAAQVTEDDEREKQAPEDDERTEQTPEERAQQVPDERDVPLSTTGDEDVDSVTEDDGSPPLNEEVAWREAKTIPSLDPSQTTTPGESNVRERSAGDEGTSATTGTSDPAKSQSVARRPSAHERKDVVSRLRSERDDLADERDRLRETIDDLRAENERLETENEQLNEEIARLEEKLDELLEGTHGASADPIERTIDSAEALSQTDLFVRYDSKGDPTLDAAHRSNANREEVNANLELEYHTRFDADEVTVGDRSFEEFLETTMEYRFVRWLVEDLLYEIRETGQQEAVRDLYDAIPEIDRIQFRGSIEIEREDGGETVTDEEDFDVVVRDRMGEPLLVARINNSRDPATGEMMATLQEAASNVKLQQRSLCSAFLVTQSFFDPSALETAAEATSGSLLSRDSRKSYVKLSRKLGFHLCLVEAREDDLHLSVPEL